jgi:hypothetical protein
MKFFAAALTLLTMQTANAQSRYYYTQPPVSGTIITPGSPHPFTFYNATPDDN